MAAPDISSVSYSLNSFKGARSEIIGEYCRGLLGGILA